MPTPSPGSPGWDTRTLPLKQDPLQAGGGEMIKLGKEKT